jgi:hypothetical protein
VVDGADLAELLVQVDQADRAAASHGRRVYDPAPRGARVVVML